MNINSLLVIIKISLRNLVRQKRRNIFLGIGIAIGTSILIIVNSFSHGLTDILLNKIIVKITGHIIIMGNEDRKNIIRDKYKIEKIIKDTIPDLIEINETLSLQGRAVGNGRADNIVLIGINTSSKEGEKSFTELYKVKEGSFEEFENEKEYMPVMIDESLLKTLNLKYNDILKIKFKTIYGQEQTARLKITTVLKANNMFFSIVGMVKLEDFKKLRGYKNYETSGYSLYLKNPKKSIQYADLLREALKNNANYLYIYGEVNNKDAFVAGFNTNKIEEFLLKYNITSEKFLYYLTNNLAIVSTKVAKNLGLKENNTYQLKYKTKYENSNTVEFKIGKIIEDNEKEFIYINSDYMQKKYYESIPLNEKELEANITNFTFKEYVVLPASRSSEEMMNKYRNLRKMKIKYHYLDVSTMYENASEVVNLENALNMISIVGVLILFLIILIGVVNTLRMTIRERTREIGTVRAIGMQKIDVRNSFIFEILFLTLFSSIVGIILAFIIMSIISSIQINVENSFSILLVNNRIYFKSKLSSIIFNVVLILIISYFTAYFPSKRASEMEPTKALRHYD